MAHLRNNEHKYKELQKPFNDDENRIKWTILEECYDDSQLEELENYWLEYADKVEGWHVINKEKKSKKRTKVADKSKMSKAQTGELNGHCTTLNQDKANEILWLKLNTKMKYKDISELYGCSPNMVSRIMKDRWMQSIPVMPVESEVM